MPRYTAIGTLLGELFGYLGQQGVSPVGPCAATWHDPGYKESDVDSEASIPIAGSPSGNKRVKIYELPAVETMASVIHHGSYSRLHDAYGAILSWIEANGYTVAGPNREIYLESKGDGNQDDETCVTELQFPVVKAA
ncbi:MAG: transcriptional regulator, effector-binding domain/component [Chthonomonadales bacterium]|nr:transcriptional regulator, effector-binding domain/component [Chthonomonadales bacterium]